MILVILLGIGFWYILQMILSSIFKSLSGDEAIGKVISTILMIIIITVVCIFYE